MTPLPTQTHTMVSIRVNKPLSPDVRIVGDERTPVVVIDDPILEPEALIRHACEEAQFSSDSQWAYPGIRTSLPDEYARALAPALVEVIRAVYGTPTAYEPQVVHQLFSLITRRPEELELLQRVPHFDSKIPHYFATVHYLNRGPHAGTGFFRHRPTRFERIVEDRFPRYAQAAEAYTRVHGMPATKYINASDDHFELIAEVDYKPNRLVMYPGNLLHSGLIEPDRDISADPATGRLTANLFLHFRERQGQRVPGG